MPAPKGRSDKAALAALVSEGFLSRLSFGVVAFALPLYARQLGMGFAEISILISVNVAVGMLLKPMAGGWVDRKGYRGSVLVALGARSVLCLLLGVAGAAWQLFLLQSLRGLAKSVRDPAVNALLATHGGSQRVARTFAWYQTAKGAAGSLGQAAAGLLLALTAGSYGWTFAVAAAVGAVPCLLLPLLMDPQIGARPSGASPTVGPKGSHAELHGEKPPRLELTPFVGFGFLVSATSRMLRRMMPLLLVEYAGLSEGQAGSLYLLAALVAVVATPLFGWIHDNLRPEPVLAARSVLNAVSSLIFIASPTYAGFAVAKVLDKSGTAAFRPAWGAMMARASAGDPKHRASRMAIMSAGEDAGGVCGPILAGALWSAFGVVPMLAARVVLAVLAEIYTLWLLRWLGRRERPAGAGAPPVVERGEVA